MQGLEGSSDGHDAMPLSHAASCPDMSYSLNSLKGVFFIILQRTIIRVMKGDSRSLDYSSLSVHGSGLRAWDRGLKI